MSCYNSLCMHDILILCIQICRRLRYAGSRSMKNLLNQIIKFGIVGLFCFFIDFGITTGLANLLGVHYLFSKFLGFVISSVVNYLLSIKFVFTKKKEMDQKKEFTIFLILSAFGLAINEIVMFLCIDVIYKSSAALQGLVTDSLMVSIGAIVATGVVMVYNFISRKLFLERK